MRGARRVMNALTLLAGLGAGLSFAVLIVAVLTQVIGRLGGVPPVWTEELTRFALLYMVAFGAGLAFRSGDLVNVDVLCEALPGRAPWLLRLLGGVLTTGLALWLLPHAWRYVAIGRMQSSPALGLRMDAVHFTVFLLLAVLAVFGVARVLGMLAGADDGRPKKAEEE